MNRKFKYIIIISAVLILIIFIGYRIVFSANIITGKDSTELFIPTGSSYNEVVAILDSVFKIKNQKVFNWLAMRKKYPSHVKPGRYIIEGNITYNELINMLRSGKQKPLNVTFNNVRSLSQLAGKVGGKIEADSLDLISFLSEESNYKKDDFNRDNIIGVFIPNTYQFFWNTDARGFYTRMLREYNLFWNEKRIARAKDKGLDPKEVAILASIINDEVAKADEKPRIAGVYLNRLKRGIPLQADPTIKFALNDFTITRVLNRHLTIESPYNTYKHRGLPPGPIGCPSIEGLEAVLNAEDHDYIYFAAKADFSGYHNFSRTLSEHNRYAAMYQRELNKRKIFK
jgi:UPF0755 protein